MSHSNAHRGHALVTGASCGIGAAIASRLLHDGWYVIGLDRAESTINAPRFSSLTLDLLDADDVRSALDAIKVNAFVHAAGFMRVGELGSLDLAAGTDMWRVNVAAAILLADTLAPKLPRGGRIVLIGSRTASGAAGRSQYVATKSALIGMARSWAMELAPRAITVNVVSPSATETPMLRDPARSTAPPRLPPIGRFVQPGEVAAVTAFLLSDEAAAITGQQIVICGGSSL
jgi:NAD(P)-dependent dehydrogenase (short-subunit alcohol dehydrogenase family)